MRRLRVLSLVAVAGLGLGLESAPGVASSASARSHDPGALGAGITKQDEAGDDEAETKDPHASWAARLIDDGRPKLLEDLTGLACAECHQGVTEEWRRSTHALAWVDPHYQKELRKIRRKKGCTGCHAPEPLAGRPAKGSPRTRKDDPHLGVTCTTCHLGADGETILGPAGHATEAHPTEAHPLFDPDQGSALCISCHDVTIGPVIGVAKDWLRSEEADGGDSCVDCHMPRVRRPWAEDPESGEPGAVRRGRSHRIAGPRDPEFLRGAFYLEAAFAETEVVVGIQNLTGHRVPGLVGRELTLEVRGYDASGDEVARAERTFDHRSYLPLDREAELRLEGRDITRLEVTGTHRAPGIPKGVPFLQRTYERD